MNHALKLVVIFLAVAILGLATQSVSSATLADHGALSVTSGIYIGASCAPQVSITRRAISELRERMARYEYPTGICITGPMETDCRAPDGIEEAWLLEKLYGPPQRWIFAIVPKEEIESPAVDEGERYFATEVDGIAVGILTSKTVSRLGIDLHGDAIRVYELEG
jgi:hypothetical protein